MHMCESCTVTGAHATKIQVARGAVCFLIRHPATSQCATLSCQVTRPLKMQCIRAACALHHLPPTRSSLSSCSHRSPMCRILRTGWSVQARYNLVCLCLCVLHHCITVDNVPFIHSKSERVCGFWFSVSTNLQKKSVNLNDKITRQKCVNQWKVLQMHHLKAKCQKVWNKNIFIRDWGLLCKTF